MNDAGILAELERLGLLVSKGGATILDPRVAGLAQASGDPRSAAAAQIEAASGLRKVGRAAAAIQALDKVLAQLEDGASAERGLALSLLGYAKRDTGDIEGAVGAHTKAEYVFAALGEATAQARERCALGRLHLEQGRLGEAQRAFVDVLAMTGAGVEVSSTIVAQAGLVEVRARRGDASDAVETMTAGLAQARADGLREAEVACLTALAYVEGLLGDASKSDEAYESALQLMRSLGTHRQAALMHASVAERRAARGEVARAQEALRAAEAVAGVGRDPLTVAAIGLARGSILEQSGDLTGALAAYWETVDTARRAGATTVDRAGCVLSGQLDPDPTRAAAYIRSALRALAAESDRAIFVLRPALASWLRERIDTFGIPAEERAAVVELLTVRATIEDAPASRGAGLQVSLLGALDVRIGGQRISDRAWRTSKAKELFSLLLIHRDRMLGRDEIIERLWPETEPGSGISNFHFTLHALRKALASTKDAKAPTVRTEGGYQLMTADRSPIDVDVFSLLLHEANRFRRLGRSDDAVRLFRAGTALYRADLLTDLDAEWVTERREDLVRQYLSALRQLAELELEREEGTAAAAACRRFLEREPYDEHVHRVLLRAYRASGDTGLMERHYRSLTHLLKSELGTQPDRETTQLFERLRGRETRLGPVVPVRVTTR